MSTTLAGPPSACCWTATKHTGTPEGRTELLGELNTYIAEPPASITSGSHKKVLLYFADIRGPLSLNSKLLQDYFAACGTLRSSRSACMPNAHGAPGFIVLGPDYFFGAPVQDSLSDRDKVAWAHEALVKARVVFPKWLDAVKATYGEETTKYTAVGMYPWTLLVNRTLCTEHYSPGYCFGAPFVLDLAEDGFIVAGNVSFILVYFSHSTCARPRRCGRTPCLPRGKPFREGEQCVLCFTSTFASRLGSYILLSLRGPLLLSCAGEHRT